MQYLRLEQDDVYPNDKPDMIVLDIDTFNTIKEAVELLC